MTPIDLGPVVGVFDDPAPVVAPTATDALFLLHTVAQPGSPTGVTEVPSLAEGRELYAGETALLACVDAFFGEGGARVIVVPLDVEGAATSLAAAGPDLGPGQIVAPEVVAPADVAALSAAGWQTNRVYVANAADGATDVTLTALVTALHGADGAGRFAEVEADTLIIPGTAPGQTREVAASVVKAALMARSDIATGNPNLAAAGAHTPGAAGVCRYVLGIKAERTQAQREQLASAQINTFRTVYGQVRAYGYRTAADLDLLAHWWDVSGSRTVMAARALEQAVAESLAFGQVDGEGAFLDRYAGGLRGELADLQRVGALYGTATAPGYRVDASSAVNPLEQLAQGIVTAQVTLKTSPFAEALHVNIIRRALTQEV